MDFHQTQAYADFLTSIGWKVEKNEATGCFSFIRKYPLLPISMMKLQRIPASCLDWEWITYIERKHHVVETVIENQTEIQLPERFKQAHDYMLNTKSLIIDLTQSEAEILKRMKPKTRYNIGLTRKKNLIVDVLDTHEIVEDQLLFESIYKVLKENAKRIGMWLIPKTWIFNQYKAFGSNGFVICIRDRSELISVATFYCSDTDCSYNLNGSTILGRKLMAPTLAVWEGILEGKARKLVNFDFDGLFDERYPKQQKRFKGYGRFKEGFGGSIYYYPPMYRKLRWP